MIHFSLFRVYFQLGRGAYVLLIMSVYWATECIPLAVTGFVPIILYPCLGILTSEEVSRSYLNVSMHMLILTNVLLIWYRIFGLEWYTFHVTFIKIVSTSRVS